MNTLFSEQIALFFGEIIKLRQQLKTLKSDNTLQSLERFENQLTLDELAMCFSDSKADAFNARLIHLLSMRWERIRNSSMCYTQKPTNTVNQLCLELAKAISPPVITESDIEALGPNAGPYHLLMPSIETSEDIYGENIHNLGLHEFILSDNERVFIPLASCLHHASVSEEGQLRHLVMIDERYPDLTPNEVDRVSHHSKQAAELYQAIIALNKQRLLGNDIGAKLSQLARQLRSGGAHGSGSELNAGSAANLGILAFGEYWEALPERQKLAIFIETPELRDILGRLFRPNDANYREVRFCVELLANALDPIILAYNNKPNIQRLQQMVSSKEQAFKIEVMTNRALVTTHNANPPKHILHHIFKLVMRDQSVLFEQVGCENALMYALRYEPESLLEFELDEASKQTAVSMRVNPKGDSALIVAATHGKTNVVTLLLNWGAHIESHDVNQSTALHWAANNGHIEAVNHLLDNGALLEARGSKNNTALNFAVFHGKGAVVELLLRKNASVNARDSQGMNALDIAIAKRPELIEPILMQMATLPMNEQAECLRNVSQGIYPNALFYAAANKPALFDALVDKTLQEPNQELKHDILNASDRRGYTPLILAAQLGAHETIRKLLASRLDLDIESHDVNQSTALHWAANNGHIEAVNHLLDNGALLEARGSKNNTALNFAVFHGEGAVVELLLRKNASVNARNNQGMNALDIAIEKHPELTEPLLMKIASLPMDEQAECLLNVAEGIYPNALFYAIANKPALFDALLDKILQEPNQELKHAMLNASNQHGDTLLILAAQLGAHEIIRKLLASRLVLDIESHDVHQDTALHWAAYNGHIDAVNLLLDHGALLEPRGYGNNTALNYAVMRGKGAVVELLLRNNANVNARNSKGMNALDIALAKRSELTEPLLMKMATLPMDEQAECLLNVSEGIYDNVFAYAAIENFSLFERLFTVNLSKQTNKDTSDITSILSKMHFDEHFQCISTHYQLMKKKSQDNSNYIAATAAARTLLIECIKAKYTLFHSDDVIDNKILTFQQTCKSAIETAKPVLTKYREWGKVLAAFLLAIITLPVSLILCAIGIFSVKTKSEQLLDKWHAAIDKPTLVVDSTSHTHITAGSG